MPSRIEYTYVYKIVFDGKSGEEVINVTATNAEYAIENFREIELLYNEHEAHRYKAVILSVEKTAIVTYVETSD